MFLVDANVIIDVLVEDGAWRAWSMAALERSAQSGRLHLNIMIYAEVATAFDSKADLDRLLTDLKLEIAVVPEEAAFLASKAFLKYRQAGGAKTSPLPDFFIGAHAAIDGLTLITRDPARFRSYFPTVTLLSPD